MSVASRRWLLAGFLVFTSAIMACNPLAAPYFLFGGLDPSYSPDFRIAGTDNKKPVKVVIIASAPLETRRELLGAEREVTTMFSQVLQDACKRNGETNVAVASPTLVQKFKDDNPMWQSMPLADLGKKLKADMVIDVEINDMSLFEPGSGNTMFLGKAAVSVMVVDVHKPEDGAVFQKEITVSYPPSGPRQVTETNPAQFRRSFLGRVATELSWLFTAHLTDEHHTCE
jgi:hypothetical protein